MNERVPAASDELDGCQVGPDIDPLRDADLPYMVLFADVLGGDPAVIEAHARAWRALFRTDTDGS